MRTSPPGLPRRLLLSKSATGSKSERTSSSTRYLTLALTYPHRTHGPLIHDKAIEKVQRHVDDALARGAQLLVGGTRQQGKGSFFQPTLLAEVPADALVHSEETFGPLGALTRFSTEEEVLRLANSTQAGLAGYFYSRDIGRVWRVAEALEVGMVGTNTFDQPGRHSVWRSQREWVG